MIMSNYTTENVNSAEKKLYDLLKEINPTRADDFFEAINDLIDAKINHNADDLRDRMDGRGAYDPDW